MLLQLAPLTVSIKVARTLLYLLCRTGRSPLFLKAVCLAGSTALVGIGSLTIAVALERNWMLRNLVRWTGLLPIIRPAVQRTLRHTGIESIRNRFKLAPYMKLAAKNNSSHPTACALRNSLRTFAIKFIEAEDCDLYYVDKAKGLEDYPGRVNHYTPKDSHMQEHSDELPPNAIYLFEDSDYYYDAQRPWWAWGGVYLSDFADRPMVINTFQPTRCGYSGEDVRYSFTGDVVDFRVVGGSKYMHRVHNWNREVVTYRKGGRVYVHKVEMRRVSHDRVSVLSLPVSSYPTWAYAMLFNFEPLLRLRTTAGFYNALTVMTPNGSFTNVSLPGSSTSITVREGDMEGLAATWAGLREKERHAWFIESKLGRQNIGEDAKTTVWSGIINMFLNSFYPLTVLDVVSAHDVVLGTGGPVKHVSSKAPSDDHCIKLGPNLEYSPGNPMGTQLRKPLADFSAILTVDNLYARYETVVRRGLGPAPKDKPTPLKYMEYLHEFVAYNIPQQGLEPWSPDRVQQHLSLPKHVKEFEFVKHKGFLNMKEVKCFLKSEPIKNISKATRMICTVTPEHKFAFSAFTLALAEHFKKKQWYSFGKHPDTIANSIVSRCQTAQLIAALDFSTYDATKGRLHKDHSKLNYLRAFPHHPIVSDLLSSEEYARGKLGFMFPLLLAQITGSPSTSLHNTVDDALMFYFVFREMGYNAELAYESLGFYGGDDSLNFDIDMAVVVQVMREFEMIITVDKLATRLDPSMCGWSPIRVAIPSGP